MKAHSKWLAYKNESLAMIFESIGSKYGICCCKSYQIFGKYGARRHEHDQPRTQLDTKLERGS